MSASPEPRPNPFLALRSFRREDARKFFGRDADLVLVHSRVYSARTTLLFAASGVGKTSFIEAKLAPTLESEWDIVSHRSWATQPPLEALQASVAASAPTLGLDRLPLVDQVRRLSDASERTRGCLVMLDQFEEVFQHWRDTQTLDAFAAEIARLVHTPRLDARVLFSMREEFLGELSLFDNLIPDLFNNCFRLKHATRAEAEEIITRTALLGGAECGPGLEPLVDDLVSASSRIVGVLPQGEASLRSRVPMPFLQIVCFRLWQQQMGGTTPNREPSARFLDGAPGPVRVELEAYCREKLRALSASEQDLASAAFGFLMTRRGAKMAYPVDVLAQLAKVPETPLLAVLEKLAGETVRILRHIPAGRDSKPWFELYHDLYARFLSEWKRERDAARETRQLWRTRVAVAALVIGSVASVVALTSWRAANQKNALFAEQLVQVAQGQTAREDDVQTPLSLRLIVESFVRDPAQARAALRSALQEPLIETGRVPIPAQARIALSPNGEVLASIVPEGVLISRLPANTPIGRNERASLVSAVAFSPDGATLAAAGWDGRVEIISTSTAQTIRSISVMTGGILNAVTFSPSGRLIAVSADDGVHYMAQIYSAQGGQPLATVPHAATVSVLVFSPDERYLLTGSDDSSARLLDVQSGRHTAFYHQAKVVAAAFKSDSQTFATSDVYGLTQVTVVPAGPTIQLEGLTGESANALAFSSQGRYLATGQGVLWELEAKRQQPLGTSGSLNVIAFSADEQMVAAAGNDGAFVVEMNARRVLARLSPGEPVLTMALGPQGDWLAILARDTLRLFRLRSLMEAPASDAELESRACALAGAIDPNELARLLGTEPPLGCR